MPSIETIHISIYKYLKIVLKYVQIIIYNIYTIIIWNLKSCLYTLLIKRFWFK